MPRIPISMPQLGESIAEGTIVEILIREGQTVEADEDVMEVETDKATMSVTAPCGGRVVSISARQGSTYPVGTSLAHLEVTEAAASKAGFAGPDPAGSSARRGDQSAAAPPPTPGAETGAATPSEVEPVVSGLPVPAKAMGAAYLSPRLKARMLELGLNAADLAGVAGTGAGGRVTIQDFEAFIANLESNRITPASTMRIAVADSMRRSWSRPLATVGRSVQLDALLRHRRESDPKPGPALYAIRALALALAANTAVAGRLVGSNIVHPTAVDIGFAVEVEDGVLVPVIAHADGKSLRELVPIYHDLVEKARGRKLTREASRPGIATVTNFGTFGIVWATPIPLPEQNLVLGLGAGTKKPRWDDRSQSFQPVTEAELTLSFDHRVLDGGAAGRLLAHVADLLSRPEEL